MTSAIVIGDKVKWTHVKKKGRSIDMTQREGVVVAIDCAMVTVRKSSGRKETIPMHRLRLVGQRGELTEFAETVFKANRERS